MQNYRIVGRMGEGTFSEVLKCQSQVDGTLYACKKMKQKYETADQVNGLREIQALRRLNPHPNIIQLKEIIFDKRSGTLSLICELMDMNIYELIKDRKNFLSEQKVRMYMYQLLKSIYHMHKTGIFHRDVKPENILIKENMLKLADFGSCKSVFSHQPYTEYISTRWYRAPECLLTDGYYTHKMDMWSVGCVMFEVMTLRPLFPGSNELDQVSRIHDIVGTPSSTLLQKFKKHQSRHMEFNFPARAGSGIGPLLRHGTKGCIEIITQLCTYDPDTRLTAKQALRHPYFKDIRDAERRAKSLVTSPPLSREMAANKMPSIQSSHQTSRQQRSNPHLQKTRNKAIKNQLVSVPEFSVLATGAGVSGGKEALPHGHFLPSIHHKHTYHASHAPSHAPSAIPSGYASMALSNKTTAHSSFLPSIYGDKVTAKHALYPSLMPKQLHHHPPPHKPHPSHLPAINKHRTGAG